MKKIVLRKPSGQPIDGYAEDNGVGYRLLLDFGNGILVVPSLFVKAKPDGTNEASASKPNGRTSLHIQANGLRMLRALTIVAIILLIATIVCAFNNYELALHFRSLMFAVIACAMLSNGLFVFFGRISGNEELNSFSKFQAAANAVRNAYCDLGRVPSIEEAQQYSYFSPRTKYLPTAAEATFCLALAVATHLPSPFLPFAMGTLFAIFWITKDKDYYFFWQFLLVSEPSDTHYEAAISALTTALSVQSISKEEFMEAISTSFSEEKCSTCPSYDFCKHMTEHNT